MPLINQYRRRAERYIRLAVGGREVAQVMPLHAQFVEACRTRDPNAAEHAMREAFAWTIGILTPQILELERGASSDTRESA
jgi:DNA-binding FadR family transcriptional regulator